MQWNLWCQSDPVQCLWFSEREASRRRDLTLFSAMTSYLQTLCEIFPGETILSWIFKISFKMRGKKCLEVFPCRSRTLYTNTACQLSDQNSEKGRTVGSNRWHLLWKCHQAPNYSSTAGCLCNRFSRCCHDVMAIILEAWDCLTPGACGNCLCYSDKGDQRISVSLSVNGYRSQHRKKHRFCFWMLELRCRDTWMVKRLC